MNKKNLQKKEIEKVSSLNQQQKKTATDNEKNRLSFADTNSRRIMTSAIDGMPVAEVRKYLGETRKKLNGIDGEL